MTSTASNSWRSTASGRASRRNGEIRRNDTREENELLPHTGRGTPMGDLLRRYWMPALLSREVEADGAPLRVRLLGREPRSPSATPRARSGCCASIARIAARRSISRKNEQCGLRCLVSRLEIRRRRQLRRSAERAAGRAQFKDKVKQPAYPCIERNGVVLSYMGPRDEKPPLPEFEWLTVPEGHVHVSKRFQECNWLRAWKAISIRSISASCTASRR